MPHANCSPVDNAVSCLGVKHTLSYQPTHSRGCVLRLWHVVSTASKPAAHMDMCVTICAVCVQAVRTPLGAFQQVTVCNRCEGQGQSFQACERCGGDGRERESKRIQLTVPAGVLLGNSYGRHSWLMYTFKPAHGRSASSSTVTSCFRITAEQHLLRARDYNQAATLQACCLRTHVWSACSQIATMKARRFGMCRLLLCMCVINTLATCHQLSASNRHMQ